VGEFEVATGGGIWVAIRGFQAACANYVMAENCAEKCAEDFPNAVWCYLVDGWFWYGLLHGRSSIKSAAAHALEANDAKLKADPKQADKMIVRECWIDWQKQPLKPDGTKKYKGKAAFAKDMREKFENLESQAVIERWCRAWERET
jgi:hypothetical protein